MFEMAVIANGVKQSVRLMQLSLNAFALKLSDWFVALAMTDFKHFSINQTDCCTTFAMTELTIFYF